MPGWFSVNVADAPAFKHEIAGTYVPFESRDERFPDYGINIHVLQPGEPNGRYHRESVQEDFLVLAGECIGIIDGAEHRFRAWDFVHCPPGTGHAFVGAGDGPCVLLCTGERDFDDETFWRVSPRSEIALRYGASVERDASSDAEARSPWRDHWRVERPGNWDELPWSSAS